MSALWLVWVVLAALYLLFAGGVSGTEVAAGLGASVAAAVQALGVRRAGANPFRLRVPWPRIIVGVLKALVVDTLRVGVALARARPGGFTPQRFRAGGERESGRRAVAVLAASMAPNGYVVALADDAFALHRLAHAPTSSDREWPV